VTTKIGRTQLKVKDFL